MKNIGRVFWNDCKHIGRNVVALIVVMGLAVLPSLYAWFNILSNWDPYGSDSTSNIKVAVAYDDTGINISGIDVNISTNIIEALKTNDTIGWVFTDTTDEAIEGVWAGDYYAALIMPEDFSKDMVSFLADNMTHPEIIYYTNQKKNAIAPKITDKAKTAVQQQVNATFISTLTEAIMKSADVADNIGANKNNTADSSSGNTNISGSSILDILIAKFQVINTQVSTFDSVLTTLSNIIGTAQSTADTAKGISPELTGTFDGEKAILNELNQTIGQSSLIDSSILIHPLAQQPDKLFFQFRFALIAVRAHLGGFVGGNNGIFIGSRNDIEKGHFHTRLLLIQTCFFSFYSNISQFSSLIKPMHRPL